MPGSGLKVCVLVVVVVVGGGVRTKFSVQLWSQAEQLVTNELQCKSGCVSIVNRTYSMHAQLRLMLDIYPCKLSGMESTSFLFL